MAHGNHELKERMRIFEEDSILNRYLGKKSMNTLEKEKFQLNREEKVLSAKIKDLREDIQEIEGKPTHRELDGQSFTNRLSAHVAMGLGIGTAVIALNSNDIGSAIPAIALGSSLFSGLVGYINNKCYEKKPLSNAINKHLMDKKEHKLNLASQEKMQLEQKQKMLSEKNSHSVLSEESLGM